MDTEDFFRLVFGTAEGYLFLSTKFAPTDKEITNHKSFRYPENLKQAVAYCRVREDEDLYFSPMLYQVPRRRAASVSHTPVVYADTDSFPVDQYMVPPSINIETSPGKHASLWILDSPDYPVEEVQAAARAIALTHASTVDGKQAGVDPGGWDLSQLLRVPNSTNLKYLVQGKYEGYTGPYKVSVVDETSSCMTYKLSDITAAYDPSNLPEAPARANMNMPDPAELPQAVDVLRKITSQRTLSELYGHEPHGSQDWSDTLYRFISEMLRAGFTPEEAFVGAWNAACNKYKRDNRPMEDLWQYDMRKALADPNNRPMPTVNREAVQVEHPKDEGISQEIEVALLNPDQVPSETFIDHYTRWASSKTDAPAAYHIASAMAILSCVYGEWGVGLPQFGELPLGLNFVIMGETTDTRKSTSRNLMKRFLRELQTGDYDYILTSDATEEALLDVLSERERKSSLYDRDEAQKLIADVKGGKGYLKGFLETLNELYDGWSHGRLRQGKRTKDTRVNFIQYLMGIRSQIQDNLEMSDFASGWGPRNIYVRGESPVRTRENSRLRQGSLDTNGADAELVSLVQEMDHKRDAWSRACRGERTNRKNVMFEDDAWLLMTDLEWDLKDYFDQHPRYEVLKPCIERLTINAMKLAILFAMHEERESVSVQDVINARYYAARWMEDLLIVVEGVHESLYMRDIKALSKFLLDNDGLVTYGSAVRWATDRGMGRRDYNDLFDTIVDQDVAVIVEDAKGRKSIKLVM